MPTEKFKPPKSKKAVAENRKQNSRIKTTKNELTWNVLRSVYLLTSCRKVLFPAAIFPSIEILRGPLPAEYIALMIDD